MSRGKPFLRRVRWKPNEIVLVWQRPDGSEFEERYDPQNPLHVAILNRARRELESEWRKESAQKERPKPAKPTSPAHPPKPKPTVAQAPLFSPDPHTDEHLGA